MNDIFFITSIEHFSYLALFVFAIFSGYLIPIPEEIILLITGYMVRYHMIHFLPAMFVVIIAFIIGDNILFKLTLKNNKYVSKLIHEVLSIKIISEKRDLIEKNVGAAIFASRFIPFLRFVGPVFSGYIKVSEKKFMFFNTLAIIVYTPFVMWAGYFFSDYFNLMVYKIGEVKHILFIVLSVISGVFISRAIDYFLNKTEILKK